MNMFSPAAADGEAFKPEKLRTAPGRGSLERRFPAKTVKEPFRMSTNNSPKLTYAVPEACKALQISRTTLWKLVRSRRLKPVRIARRVLFTTRALDEFLNGDRTTPR
jgi:excisionase family DNA binding protein